MKTYKKRPWGLKLIITAAVFTLMCFGAAAAQPGSAEDPLVSKFYMDSQMSILQAQISILQSQLSSLQLQLSDLQSQLETAQAQTGSTDEPVRNEFKVVFASANSIIIGMASTEIILRSGEATVVSGINGLVDVTAGVDIVNGEAVSRNHLLIVPQNDGRGLHMSTDAYLMIKGDFYVVGGF